MSQRPILFNDYDFCVAAEMAVHQAGIGHDSIDCSCIDMEMEYRASAERGYFANQEYNLVVLRTMVSDILEANNGHHNHDQDHASNHDTPEPNSGSNVL